MEIHQAVHCWTANGADIESGLVAGASFNQLSTSQANLIRMIDGVLARVMSPSQVGEACRQVPQIRGFDDRSINWTARRATPSPGGKPLFANPK